MNAKRKEAGELRRTAMKLLELAADLDPRGAMPPSSDPHRQTICDTCGAEYSYAAGYRAFQECESCEERGVKSYLRWADDHGACTSCAEPVRGERHRCRDDEVKAAAWCANCEECGMGVSQVVFDNYGGKCPVCGERLWHRDSPRELPDEPLTTRDGRSMGVTMSALASAQAFSDAMAEHYMSADLDDLSDRTDDLLDIASTYRGGRHG